MCAHPYVQYFFLADTSAIAVERAYERASESKIEVRKHRVGIKLLSEGKSDIDGVGDLGNSYQITLERKNVNH